MKIRRSISGPSLVLGPISQKRGVATFHAFDLRRRHKTVMKVQQPTEDHEAIERFRREAIALSLVDHPNVVSLYEYSESEPRTLTLEYIKADNLADRVANYGPLAPESVCRFVEDVAAALDCSHARGVLHRDVCPDNILLPRRGPARLIDYGIAKIVGEPQITLMGHCLRDNPYVSPEQSQCDSAVDARADVYSLAAVAYYALTGVAPSEDYTPARTIRPDLAGEIDAVITRGLSSDPQKRYQTAGQLAADLRMALESCRSRNRAASGVPTKRAVVATVVAAACILAVFFSQALIAGLIAPKRTAPPAQPRSVHLAIMSGEKASAQSSHGQTAQEQ